MFDYATTIWGTVSFLEVALLDVIWNLIEALKLMAEQVLKAPEVEKVKYVGMLKG